MKRSKKVITKLLFGLAVYSIFPFMSVGAVDFGLIQCKYTTKYMSDKAASYNSFDFELVYSDYRESASIGDSDTNDELSVYNMYYYASNGNKLTIGPTQFLSNYYAANDSLAYGNVGKFAVFNGMWDGAKDPMADKRASQSFKTALKEKNDCPKYFYLKEKASGDSKVVEPIFTNTKPEMCSSSFDSNEPCHVMLEGKTTFSNVIDEEKSWAYSINCPDKTAGESIGASIDIHSKGNVLRYNSLNKTTSDFIPADDITNGLVHDVKIYSVYLLEHNTQMKIGYNPREKNGKKSWVDGLCFPDENGYVNCGDDYCTSEKPIPTHYNCTTYDDIKSEIEEKEAGAVDAIKTVRQYRDKYLDSKPSPYNAANPVEYVAHTKNYYMTKDVNTLILLNTQIKSAAVDIDKKVDVLNEYLNYISNKSSEMCENFKNKLDAHSTNEMAKAKEAQDILKKLSEEVSNIKDALIELGATKEQLADVDLTSEELKKVEDKAYQLVELSQENILASQDFGLGKLGYEGCGTNGLLSADMKKVLNLILWYIRIVGVVLAIILSILDYIKASAGSDEKSLAAANKKFVTRMILVAVLFLLPVLLDTVLGLYNPTTAESIKCLAK